MDLQRPHHLRVLIADGEAGSHGAIVSIVTELGHQVIARDLDVAGVAAATAELMPDVALVCVGDSSARALALISGIVQEAACPVIAVLDASDPQFINEAAQRGTSPTSPTATHESCKARWTSSFAASPNSRASKAPSADAR
jgi:AmiR/NasT family two-component response regulator